MRTVTFADGFVSTSAPIVEGIEQETYLIENNQLATDLFSIDATQYKSAFIDFELSRSDDVSSYIQTGSLVLFYDGTSWNYSILMTQNDDILAETIVEPYNVVLTFTTSGDVGTLRYASGSMFSSYTGQLKAIVSKVKVV
jgi:hypothetical protein